MCTREHNNGRILLTHKRISLKKIECKLISLRKGNLNTRAYSS